MAGSQLAILGGPKAIADDAHSVWPEILEEDRRAVLSVLDEGLFSAARAADAPGGVAPAVDGLEREFAAYVGVEHCLALNSGTAALHCGLNAAGVRPGDEVILPAFTFVASAMAIAHQGASPVFCDIDPATFCLDFRRVRERITDRTRAILPVHIHGLPADMDEIIELAKSHDLAVIEDACQAHGATYRERKVGTLGSSAGFSLNVSKNLSGGEGGLFVTDNPDAMTSARRLANFGEDLPPPNYFGRYYWSHGVGWNYRNQELSAALARSQLSRLDSYNARAQKNAARLTAGLKNIEGVEPPQVPEDRTSVFHIYRLRLDASKLGYDGPATALRDRAIIALRAEGVSCGIWQHHPLSKHPAFRRRLLPWNHRDVGRELTEYDALEFPETTRLCNESVVLGSGMNPLQVQEFSLMDDYVAAVDKVLGDVDLLSDAVPAPTGQPSELALT